MHQSIPAAPSPSPPRATAGHLPALPFPGVGHLQILCCPVGGDLPTPGPFPIFWHARGFLSEYNYTEDFTGKESRLAHLSGQEKIGDGCKGMFLILCMHFFIACQARIHREIGSSVSTWINVFLVIQSSFYWHYLKNILSNLKNYS